MQTHHPTVAVSHGDWIINDIRLAYHTLFEQCDDSKAGQAACKKVVKDLIEWKQEQDKSLYKQYADITKSFKMSLQKWRNTYMSK
jgi:hypothetical protein